jgi:hypothetical protein
MRNLCSLLVALMCWTPAAGGQQVAFGEPTAIISGALISDDFNDRQLDATVWSRPNWMVEHNPYIAVGVENGRLLISGNSHPEGKDHQYVGVISRYFRETDVVLVARIRAQSSFEKEGRIQHMVHLCSGDWPDFFTEIIFGRISNGPPQWFSAYVGKLWEYSGFTEYLQPARPATGDESTNWHTVALVHDGITGETQDYLVRDRDWAPVGPEHNLHFNHTHVELKVDVSVVNSRVQMEVDDVRLYLNPAHNPATIVLSSRIINENHPELPIKNQKIRIFEDGSTRLLGEGMTDEGGQARVFLRKDALYPVAVTIEVWNEDKEILHSKIPGTSVHGLYPGDVWALRTDPNFAIIRSHRAGGYD